MPAVSDNTISHGIPAIKTHLVQASAYFDFRRLAFLQPPVCFNDSDESTVITVFVVSVSQS